MLRSLLFSALGLLLAGPALAQTTPARKPAPKAASRPMRDADPLAGTHNSKGLNDYASPGEPINDPAMNGKNTPPYNGPAARRAAPKGTTLTAPK